MEGGVDSGSWFSGCLAHRPGDDGIVGCSSMMEESEAAGPIWLAVRKWGK